MSFNCQQKYNTGVSFPTLDIYIILFRRHLNKQIVVYQRIM